jgi:hypothetical protein
LQAKGVIHHVLFSRAGGEDLGLRTEIFRFARDNRHRDGKQRLRMTKNAGK